MEIKFWKKMDPLKQIEYDGYLDRSRLGPWLFAEGSLIFKKIFFRFSKSFVKE